MEWSQKSAEDMAVDEAVDDMEDVIDSEPVSDTEEDGASNFLPSRSCEAIESIEDMIISFLSQLSSFGRTSRSRASSDMMTDSGSEDIGTSPVNHRNKSKIELQLADRVREGPGGSTAFKCVKFPKRCAKGSIRPMAQLLRVLDLTHEALVDDVPATKRDIYYRDVPLFRSQRVVDTLVDDLAATFELDRSDLNIRATSKGLVCGSSLTIQLYTEEMVQILDTEGTLIPVGEDIKSFTVDPDVAWVLVVEKEAVFQTLCRLKFTCHPSLPGCGLIITGKGYPDVATRHLVKTLADALPFRIPILGMVDGDPYGIDILSVYKYGSQSLRHENAKLAAQRIEWLGLRSSELETLGVDKNRLLQITKHDEAKVCPGAISQQWLLSIHRPSLCFEDPRARCQRIGGPDTLLILFSVEDTHVCATGARKELMHMLHSRRKAEIEILSTTKLDSCLDGFRRMPFDAPNEMLPAASDTNLDLETCHHAIVSCSSPSDAGSCATPLSSPTTARSSYSSPLTSPPSSPLSHPISNSSAPSHAPLMRYLVHKITESVTSARARAISAESSTSNAVS